MSLGSSLQATLGLNISEFRKKLDAAVKGTSDARKKMQAQFASFGAGGIGGMLGIGALIAALKAAAGRAQDLRDTAYETGAPLSASAKATAEFADNIETALGWLGKLFDKAVQLGGVLQGYVNEGFFQVMTIFKSDEEKAEIRKIMAAQAEQAEATARFDATKETRDQKASEAAQKAKEDEAEAERHAKELAEANVNVMKIIQAGIEKRETLEESIVRLKKEELELKKQLNGMDRESLTALKMEARLHETINERLDIGMKLGEKMKDLDEKQFNLLQNIQDDKSFLPTLAEAASGKRVSGRVSAQARELWRLDAQDRRLGDRSRALGSGAGSQDLINAEQNDIANQRLEIQGRMEALKAALGDQISDTDSKTMKDQLAELKLIKDEAKLTATALKAVRL